MSKRYYPHAFGEGKYTREEALDRWPLARKVYEQLDGGPASVEQLAKQLGLTRRVVDEVLWWLELSEDNGAEQMVHGHGAIRRHKRDRQFMSTRFAHRTDLKHGCQITVSLASRWIDRLDEGWVR